MHKAPDFSTMDNRLQARISKLFFCKAAHRAQSLGEGHSIRNSDQPRDFS